MTEKLAGTGVSISEYLRRFIITDLEGHQDYMVKLMSQRLLQASVHLADLSQDSFSEQEFAHPPVLASDIGAAAFGPLPVQPYDFDRPTEVMTNCRFFTTCLKDFRSAK